jgi:membrane-associated phospholipid phosphatase
MVRRNDTNGKTADRRLNGVSGIDLRGTVSIQGLIAGVRSLMKRIRIKKVEWVVLWFTCGLAALTLINLPHLKDWPAILSIYALTLGIYALVVAADTRWPHTFLAYVRRWTPYAGALPLFQSLGYIIPYIRPDLDAYLIRIEYAMFGVHPTVWLERLAAPWFVDVMAAAYLSYYFFPILLALALEWKKKIPELEHMFLAVTICFFISYLGYLLVPAIGPRFTLAELHAAPLKGLIWGNRIMDFLSANEFNKRDCFPSGHTATTLVVMYFAHRYAKKLFALLLPVAVLMIFSTVFLRMHYVIDVIFGVVTAVLAVRIAALPCFHDERAWRERANRKTCVRQAGKGAAE